MNLCLYACILIVRVYVLILVFMLNRALIPHDAHILLDTQIQAPEPPEKSYSTTWNTSDRLNPCLIETSSANVIE